MEAETQEQLLENSLKQHEQELAQVVAAMHVTEGSTKEELKQLMVDLEQLIQLTKETLQTMKGKNTTAKSSIPKTESSVVSSSVNRETQNTNNDMDLEFSLFQSEIASLEQSAPPPEPIASSSSESSLLKDLEALEGTKCQAPFSQEWGEHSYHNALVLSAEPSDNIASLEDIKVRVMFCNPLNQSMQPCPYFLDGSCRFTEENCRFSHGHVVQLSALKEFHNPDYSLLQRDSKCLARYADKLWYKAVVEEVQSDHRYVVKFEKYNNVATVDLEEILPLEPSGEEASSESDDDALSRLAGDIDDDPDILVSSWPVATSCALGDWEKHTRGIGSKLMEKMGYIFGQGLGKNGEGRTEPVEAVILPQGKSLDKCIELRENGLSRDPIRRKRKQLLKQKRHDAKVAAGYNYVKSSVFDFLNSKIGQSDDVSSPSTSKKHSSKCLKSTTTKNLNVQSMKLDEDIRKSERELQRLQVALTRNQNSDKVVTAQLKNKIAASEEQLAQLRKTEKSIQREQMSRKDHKKLTIF